MSDGLKKRDDMTFAVTGNRPDEKTRFANELYRQLEVHEGRKPEVYKDSLGHPTIGIGFNLDDPANVEFLNEIGLNHKELVEGARALSEKEIKTLYNRSVESAYKDAKEFLPDLNDHPPAVRKAVIDMAFNLGRGRLMGFKKARAALQKKDYQTASAEMLDSKWAKQVKGRALTLADMVRNET